MPEMKDPVGFDAFWDEVESELDRYAARPQLEPMPRHSTSDFTVHWVRLTSVGPYRIGGYFSVPTGIGPFPALMTLPRYGSVNPLPHYHDCQRYVMLTLMHRGQRLADQPFAAAYPGLLTAGIQRPDSYVYRGIVADLLRGAEFLASRPEVDPHNMAIAGDDLALITAARRPVFTFIQVTEPRFYRLMAAASLTAAYPIEEINDYLRSYPEQRTDVEHTLSLFDPVHHAPRIRAPTLLCVKDPQTTGNPIGGPDWIGPLEDTFGGPLDRYQLTYEGGTDNDWLDASLAARLGTPPMSRFL